MNIEEPDKFEQFMAWTGEAFDVIESSAEWFAVNLERIAFISAVPVLVLAALVVAQARKRNPQVSGMRHARQ